MRTVVLAVLLGAVSLVATASDYAVVVDSVTQADSAWAKVTVALVKKHNGELIVYDGDVEKSLPDLRRVFPTYACFVTRPENAGTAFVVRVNRLIRQLDDDPYADAVHAILTGYTAEAALRTVLADEPKVASTALLSCGVGPERFKESAFISDGQKGRYGRKFADGRIENFNDTSNKGIFFADMVETMSPDVIMTSSHGSQVNIEMPFGEGGIVAKKGKIWRQRGNEALIDYSTGQARKETIDNDRLILIAPPAKPNIFFAFGNCLTGDVYQPDCIALDVMNHLKSTQFIGYCFTTWYGLQGGLTLRYWEQGGGYTPLNEAHFFANQVLLNRLEKVAPDLVGFNYSDPSSRMNMGKLLAEISPMVPSKDRRVMQQCLGMVWDRDCVAFFGDPAHACFLDKDHTLKPDIITDFSGKDGTYRFTLTAMNNVDSPNDGTSFRAALFPERLTDIQIVSGAQYNPVITDNFIFIDKPGPIAKGQSIEVVFTAKPVKKKSV